MSFRYIVTFRLLLAALICAMVGGLSGCHRSSSSKADALVLTLDWVPEPEFGGFYAAQKAGLFDQHGLKDLQLQSAGAGAPTWQLVASGKTTFATTNADQVLSAREQGADIVAIFAVYQTFPQGIMVHKARGFQSIGDVFSHKGVLLAAKDTWLQFLTTKYPNPKVAMAPYPTPGVDQFLREPDYSQECFVTSEPIQAKRHGGDPQTFLIADAGYDPYCTVVICSGQTLKDHPDQVKAMVAACREGWESYFKDPDPANAVMESLNKDMDAETFKAAAAAQRPLIETDETRKNGLGTMTQERWDHLAKQLIDLDVIKKAPTGTYFVNP